ncbi:MAG: flagellar hook-basal body complex protein FliE [Chloroflexi bacterium]|nr:flagellar hook-basal body complex protein FliE [Chloroflexota bacterium]
MAISAINPNPIPAIPEIGSAHKPSSSSSTSPITQTFGNMLSGLDQSQKNSDTLVSKLVQGENVDLHAVMIGMEENNVNFNVALGIRDKLVEAYREVMRMQV